MSVPESVEFKSTGTPWFGKVPSRWRIRRLGTFFRERRQKVNDKDFAPLSVTKGGVVPRLETAAKTDDGDNRKLVCSGDFVINSRSDRKGSAGASRLDGSVSLINTVLRPLPEIDISFAHYLLRSKPFQEEFYRWGKGIVADLWSTNYSEMRNVLLALPDLQEQQAISSFLDCETAKIDALIAEQERLTILLSEKRQTTISRAVTLGLDPDRPMKNSGSVWLKHVPAHWVVCSVRRVLNGIEQGWSPDCLAKPAEGDEWGVLKTGCVNGGKFNPSENKTLPESLTPDASIEVKDGDVLMSRASGSPALVGAIAYVSNPPARRMLSDKTFRFNFVPWMFPQFFVLMLSAKYMRRQIEQAISGADGLANNLPQSALKSFVIAVPPLAEQNEIVKEVNAQTSKLDVLQEQTEQAIALLKERRNTLIAAAVTGKFDVPEVTVRRQNPKKVVA